MSGDPRPRYRGALVSLLICVCVALPLLTFEVVRRKQYVDARLAAEAALAEFERRSRLTFDKNDDPEVAAEGVAPKGEFRLTRNVDAGGAPWWTLTLIRHPPAPARGYIEAIEITLPQVRRMTVLLVPGCKIRFSNLHVANSIYFLLHDVFQKHGVPFEFLWPLKTD